MKKRKRGGVQEETGMIARRQKKGVNDRDTESGKKCSCMLILFSFGTLFNVSRGY